ncbi:putative serine/threonine-protein kinase TOR [Iris pallida]|uniref:Serine/threonine-protein kinase TOR n=1 Tax=Iris pallida TaxID=29817 RepID=A0AAX6EES8_IRIPA|nr:putative serine/threonine-protein kinase TOR [Iris pallida]
MVKKQFRIPLEPRSNPIPESKASFLSLPHLLLISQSSLPPPPLPNSIARFLFPFFQADGRPSRSNLGFRSVR